jgi:hypothetical protein
MVLSPSSSTLRVPLGVVALLVACADPPPVTKYQVQLVAEGTGTVAGAAGALDCTLPAHGGSCSFEMETGTEGLVITATPAAGYLFTGWRPLGPFGPDGAVAACAGSTDPVCELPIGPGPVMLRPRFEHPGIVTVAVVGEGTVRSTAHACGEESGDQELCRRSFPTGTVVSLKASGDGFRGWAEPCYLFSTSCTVAADSALTMTAYFQQDPPVTAHTLQVQVPGAGSGRIRSLDDAGALIDCSGDQGVMTGRCAARLPVGATVRLGLEPAPGSVAYGVGPAECGDGECTIAFDQERRLIARFEPSHHDLTVTGRKEWGRVVITTDPDVLRCDVRKFGGYDCGAVTLPYGSRVLVRAILSEGAAIDDLSRGWSPCGSGAFCRTAEFANDTAFELRTRTKQQEISFYKDGDLPGGLVHLDVEYPGPLHVTFGGPLGAVAEGSYDLDTAAVLGVRVSLPDSLRITEWGGECAGTAPDARCVVTLHGDRVVRFRIGRRP